MSDWASEWMNDNSKQWLNLIIKMHFYNIKTKAKNKKQKEKTNQ